MNTTFIPEFMTSLIITTNGTGFLAESNVVRKKTNTTYNGRFPMIR